MIEFLKIQYRMGKIIEEQLSRLVKLGRITEQDKINIMEEV